MKFRQYWRTVHRDVYWGLALCSAAILPAYYATISTKNLSAFLLTLGGHIIFFSWYVWSIHFLGIFANTFIFDDETITYIARKEKPKQMRWEDIDRIVRTRHDGRSLVIWDVYGQEFWFGNNKKIEGYIHTHHPELDHLFPEKNDIRRWQDWDKKELF